MEPRISILLPAFNAASTLPACLRSIERQSCRHWECVLVDDGSGDDTPAIARRFARRDGRIRVLSAPHRGLVAALNAGLAVCRGKFVARMDADDVMHRRRLEVQTAALATHPRWSAVGSHVRVFPRARLGAGYRRYEAWINAIEDPETVRREAFVECPVVHPTFVARRTRLAALGYREQGWPEDYDLVLRMVTDGDRIGIVPQRLLAWRHRPERLSLTAPTYAIDRFTACKARFLADSILARAPEYILWGYGGTGRTLRHALDRLGRRPSHIIELHAGRLGNRIHGAPVVPSSELPRLPRRPVIVSVAGAGPRHEIREALATMGFTETRDFVCAA